MKLSAEKRSDGRLIVNAQRGDGNSYGFELAHDAPFKALATATQMLIEKLAGVSHSDVLLAVHEAVLNSRKG